MGQGINQIIKLFPHEKLGPMMPRGPPQAWDAWDEFRVEMPMWKTDWRTGAGQMWMDQALDESNIERIFWGETEGYAAEFSSIVKLSDFFFAMLLVSWHVSCDQRIFGECMERVAWYSLADGFQSCVNPFCAQHAGCKCLCLSHPFAMNFGGKICPKWAAILSPSSVACCGEDNLVIVEGWGDEHPFARIVWWLRGFQPEPNDFGGGSLNLALPLHTCRDRPQGVETVLTDTKWQHLSQPADAYRAF